MSEKLSQEKFLLKFNIQKLLGLGIDDNDTARISNALDIDEGLVRTILDEFDDSNAEAAGSIIGNLNVHYRLRTRKKATVVFIGDSITSDRESYFNIIRYIFNDNSSLNFVDASLSGATTCDVINRFYSSVLNHSPDAVSIMIGTNDMRRNNDPSGKNMVGPEEYEKNMKYMVDTLKHNGIQMILNTIPPADNQKMNEVYNGHNWFYKKEDYDVYNDIIRKLAYDNFLPLNDIRYDSLPIGIEHILSYDGIHLSKVGQKFIASKFLSILIEDINCIALKEGENDAERNEYA